MESKEIADKEYLYPTLNDPNFNIKITEKKQFNDTKYSEKIYNVKKRGEELCNQTEFELSPTQMFVRNFLSFQTPYNNLLLYHGLGTGKTCSSILVCEEMREFMKDLGISKRIIIVCSPNVQENFKLQLFDERKLKNINGRWNLRACTGNSFIKEINPMYMEGLQKSKVVKQIKEIIRKSYLFMGYTEFSNYITRILKKFTINKERNAIEREFSHRLIVIDEVHNIRSTIDNKQKKIANNLLKLVKYTKNLKLLLLSATPMFNSYKEIIWLLNLMNLNDNRYPISIKEVFNKDGGFVVDDEGNQIGKELLIRKATGYISYVRGENPYTFPYRIYPSKFNSKNTLGSFKYPRRQLNNSTILTGIQFLDIFISNIGSYQKKAYMSVIENLKEKFPSMKNMEMGLGYTALDPPLQVLNISYPSVVFDTKDKSEEKLYGIAGLNRIMKYSKSTKRNFEYRAETLEKYGKIFSHDIIGEYSGKIHSICQQILGSSGMILIYSQFITGGCVPIALALEELGFVRYGNTKNSLFKTRRKNLNAITMKEIHKADEPIATYAMITGDIVLSPNNVNELKVCTDENNINGEKIKVVIISKAGSEGLDFKNIRQIHILEPWYNLNRIEQIIGRGVRRCSHRNLPYEERNTEIYLYGTNLNEDVEAADLYVYRLAERKAIRISTVSRILKETAIDCMLNKGQTNLSTSIMNQNVNLKLSCGQEITYDVGDHPYTAVCDYMKECAYGCKPCSADININMDSYNEKFILMNLEKIIQRIRNLMKESYIYKKEDLIMRINHIKKYPLMQIYAALNQLIKDRNEYITDMLDRIGFLVNIADYYMFQPVEIENKNITRFERVHPLNYNRPKIKIILPDEITKLNKDKIDINKIIQEIKSKFNAAANGDTSYKLYNDFFIIIQRLEEFISRDLLLKYILEHIIDSELYSKKELINYIFNNKLSEFELKIKEYLKKFILDNGKDKGIMFLDDTGFQLEIFDKKELRRAKPTEIQRLENNIRQKGIKLDQMSDIIGFMGVVEGQGNQEKYVIFKIKDLLEKRSSGARCDQISRKIRIMDFLNKIIKNNTKVIEGDKYINNNINQKKGKKKISSKQLCLELELVLRYYDDIKEGGKRWFLNILESFHSEIEKNKTNKIEVI